MKVKDQGRAAIPEDGLCVGMTANVHGCRVIGGQDRRVSPEAGKFGTRQMGGDRERVVARLQGPRETANNAPAPERFCQAESAMSGLPTPLAAALQLAFESCQLEQLPGWTAIEGSRLCRDASPM
jgi:hypothetical protein